VAQRSRAMAVCTIFNWGANFLVAQTFLSLAGAISQQGVFFLYAGLALISVVFFWIKVPETRGRSLEEIQEDLVGTDH
jgi:Na+/melibiose symporter-like transporter